MRPKLIAHKVAQVDCPRRCDIFQGRWRDRQAEYTCVMTVSAGHLLEYLQRRLTKNSSYEVCGGPIDMVKAGSEHRVVRLTCARPSMVDSSPISAAMHSHIVTFS